jgi:hypothetical protein
MLDDELVVAACLPAPTDPPLVHHSPGVPVRIGFPRPVGTPALGAPADVSATADGPGEPPAAGDASR